MLSPNYGTSACKKGRGTRTVPSLRGKSSGNYEWELSVDYQWELSLRIMREERERERWKARRVNPTLRLMLSPYYGTRACKKGRGTRTVPSLRGKSSGIIRGLSEGEGERERKKGTRRDIEREGEIREKECEREREWERERWKARRVNPTLLLMLSPDYGTRACKKREGTRTVPSLRGKSSGIIRGLSVGIITEN